LPNLRRHTISVDFDEEMDDFGQKEKECVPQSKARKRPNLTAEQRWQKAVSVLQVRPNPDHLVVLGRRKRFAPASHTDASVA